MILSKSRIILNKSHLAHSKPLMTSLSILNIYQVNLHQILIFMFKAKHHLLPRAFQPYFRVIKSIYDTRISNTNFVQQKKLNNKSLSFCIKHRGPLVWNSLLNSTYKLSKNLLLYKSSTKYFLLSSSKDEKTYF